LNTSGGDDRKDGPMPNGDNWAAILAGGDGQRLRSFTRTLTGDERPKQFCRLLGTHTLLAETRQRVCLHVAHERTVYVVSRAHEPFYRDELTDAARWQVVEQPVNRGTTAAVLYALRRIRAQGGAGALGLFPADHFYSDQAAFRRAIQGAYALAHARPRDIVLVGAEPDHPETEYGWIEPGPALNDARMLPGLGAPRSVKRFAEKPSADVARALMARRSLWNTMIVVGHLDAFDELLAAAVPDLWRTFAALDQPLAPAVEAAMIDRLYGAIGSSDFSRDVLASQPDRLAVVNLRDSGWTDLGQPARVLDVLGRRHAPDAHQAAG
jgi:mannose-1-phosphate guanylyltransferase